MSVRLLHKIRITHFRVASSLCFKGNNFTDLFYSHANKTHFHNKGFALSLVLKARVSETRKWPISTVSSGLTKKLCFCSWLAQGLSARSFFSFARFIVNAVHFLFFFSFLCHYVPLRWSFWWRKNNYNYNFLLISRLFCIDFFRIARFANFLPTVLKTWTPCKCCK